MEPSYGELTHNELKWEVVTNRGFNCHFNQVEFKIALNLIADRCYLKNVVHYRCPSNLG